MFRGKSDKKFSSDEWYTPRENILNFIEQVPHPGRVTQISLDPYSCALANQEVRAKQYFDKKTDGNIQPWGRQELVWINPPFSDMKKVVAKLELELSKKAIEHLFILTKNATDTKAIQRLMMLSDAVIFLQGRVKHHRGDGQKDFQRPNNGHMITYFGPAIDRIVDLVDDNQLGKHNGVVMKVIDYCQLGVVMKVINRCQFDDNVRALV